ncbi:MAG: transporter [Lachnospiraceae bacterium]|jgi:ABC-2 type transport system ATP-binding protein|nr:transporter [Lachnospiraceae bacterium]
MLEIKNLTKRYGKFTALNNLNLHINQGEIFGFVGPNGAGKTTAMKIIAGLLTCDTGEVYVDGIGVKANPQEIKKKIGYMPDFFGVYDNLKAIEYMEFFASIYGIEGKEARDISLRLIDLVDLTDHADSYVDSLSRGMKQRLCLARSLIHNPELLILDEPASGLDPRARYEMKEIIKKLHEQGKTIVISSHILPELAQMCTNIGIIENGKMAVTGTVEEILAAKGSMGPLVMRIGENLELAVRILKEDPRAKNISILENSISAIYLGDEKEQANLLSAIVSQGVKVSCFGRESNSLESLFLQITGQEDREGGPSK